MVRLPHIAGYAVLLTVLSSGVHAAPFPGTVSADGQDRPIQSEGKAINDQGIVIGDYHGVDGVYHSFLWRRGKMVVVPTKEYEEAFLDDICKDGLIVGERGPVGGPHNVILWDGTKLTDLGKPYGNMHPREINDAHDAAGFADLPTGKYVAWVLMGRKFIKLNDLGGGSAQALFINNHGQVAGNSSVNSKGDMHAFLWSKGKMADLGTLGGPWSVVSGINDNGQVIGLAVTKDNAIHACLWSSGKCIDLGAAAGPGSQTTAIRNNGDIVGYASEPAGTHALLWTGGKILDLGTLGGASSQAFGITSNGLIYGNAQVDRVSTNAFIWKARHMTSLGHLAGGNGSYISTQRRAVNTLGQAVGSAEVNGQGLTHAFVYTDGKMIDLGTVIVPSKPVKTGISVP